MSAALTVADVRQLCKDFTDRQGTRWDDPQFLRFIRMAHRLVYRAAVAVDPSEFIQLDRITFPADTASIDLSQVAYLARTPYKLLSVALLAEDAVLATDNSPIPIDIVPSYQDLHRRFRSNDSIVLSDANGEPLSAMFMFFAKPSLYVAPIQGQARELHIAWVPEWRTLSADGDSVLTNEIDAAADQRAIAYHETVVALVTQFIRANEVNLKLPEVIKMLQAEAHVTEGTQVHQNLMGYEDPMS